jgi:hypothetical protein
LTPKHAAVPCRVTLTHQTAHCEKRRQSRSVHVPAHGTEEQRERGKSCRRRHSRSRNEAGNKKCSLSTTSATPDVRCLPASRQALSPAQ